MKETNAKYKSPVCADYEISLEKFQGKKIGDEITLNGVWYSITNIVKEPDEEPYMVLTDQEGEEITTSL